MRWLVLLIGLTIYAARATEFSQTSAQMNEAEDIAADRLRSEADRRSQILPAGASSKIKAIVSADSGELSLAVSLRGFAIAFDRAALLMKQGGGL